MQNYSCYRSDYKVTVTVLTAPVEGLLPTRQRLDRSNRHLLPGPPVWLATKQMPKARHTISVRSSTARGHFRLMLAGCIRWPCGCSWKVCVCQQGLVNCTTVNERRARESDPTDSEGPSSRGKRIDWLSDCRTRSDPQGF